MQPNTLETAIAAEGRRFTIYTDAALLAQIERHRARIQEQTGFRLSLSQATTSLLRRGLEAASGA
ncbi:hypothetical protein [Paraburkholderia sacchari]|uniref:hypothetical protein n=1 Tax=Paraburkholderia sacchari TaxID=159450 RepID=UPI00054310D3|nr:hypothetical protein [Paraburkholderia sacchari]NLP64292.1 hypothetical protein [Paraburkholderia sacchari]